MYGNAHCLQGSLLIKQKEQKKSFVSTANKPLAGTLITIGDVKTVSTARKISQITPTMALSF